MTELTKEQINKLRARIKAQPKPWAMEIVTGDEPDERQGMLNALDALEEAQVMIENLQKAHDWAHSELSRTSAIAQDHVDALQAENERLRAALRLAEQKCRRLVGTKTADHHIAVLEECRACGAQFSSATPTRGLPHHDGCPFKILEEK